VIVRNFVFFVCFRLMISLKGLWGMGKGRDLWGSVRSRRLEPCMQNSQVWRRPMEKIEDVRKQLLSDLPSPRVPYRPPPLPRITGSRQSPEEIVEGILEHY